jgi:hypothetical protein
MVAGVALSSIMGVFASADIGKRNRDARPCDVVVVIFIQLAGLGFHDQIFAGMPRTLAQGGLLLLHGYIPVRLSRDTGGTRLLDKPDIADLLQDRFKELDLHLAEYQAVLSEGSRYVGRHVQSLEPRRSQVPLFRYV